MAKRFTCTDKWNKSFMRKLKPTYKLLWLYILDECNPAGIWDVDIEVAQVKTGGKISEADALKFFGDKVILIDGGEKWFIPSFIDFQYGELSETNRAHSKTILLLTKYGLIDSDLKLRGIDAPSSKTVKPLVNNAKAPIYKEEVKVEVEEEEEVEEKDPPPKKTIDPAKPHLFKESVYSDQEKFIEAFKGTDYEGYNLQFYYQSVSAWSDNGNKKIDWIATARNFMLKDFKDGKPVLKNGSANSTTSKYGRPATGGNVSTASAFSTIDAMYPEDGDG